MKNTNVEISCQIQSVAKMDTEPKQRVRKPLRRRLGYPASRIIEKYLNNIKNFLARIRGRNTKPVVIIRSHQPPLQAGDLVRVRSLKDIKATLDHSGKLKGCAFAEEMEQYCGSDQRVLKPVARFVDERDFSVRNARGIVILENLTCNGTVIFGPCDRNCYYFWREEWLEKINSTSGGNTQE
jgi:hypothetical protein